MKNYKHAEVCFVFDLSKPNEVEVLPCTYGDGFPEFDSPDDLRTAYHFETQEWQEMVSCVASGKPFAVGGDYGYAISYSL